MSAFIFVPLLAGGAVVAFVVAVFAAHYYLTIVECTAQGSREIHWPAEAFYEWLGKPVYLLWTAALWLFPAMAVAVPAGVGGGTVAGVILSLFAMALLFPVGQLSAFVAGSPWTPFHPKALVLLAAKPGVTAGFVAIATGLAVMASVGGFLALNAKAVNYGGWFVGSVLVAFAWLLYARVVGRLLFVLTYTKEPRRRSVRGDGPLPVSGSGVGSADPVLAAAESRRKRNAKKPKPRRVRPTDAALDTPDGPVTGYGVRFDDEPPAAAGEPREPRPRPRRPWDDEDDTPYHAHAPEVEVAKVVPKDVATPRESEMRLLEPTDVPPPTRPWGPEVWAFLGQSETARSGLTLAVFLVFVSVIVRVLIDTKPG